ncbi:hemagglutinin repeat-containing protein [Pantoea sp. B65]|uniref:two-partner secretion domain-containing protein n=1 Tax=Pantoea sp. B65 TaxID=2813359 RepID=UPI0039B67CAA
MNKNLYRVIFNRARGLLMVVAEINRGQGKSSRAPGAGHTLSQLIGRISPVAFFTMAVTGMVTLAPTALAAGIVADKGAAAAQQPTIMQSANGTPQVNIQTPSAGGVSHNKYTQFDVAQQGAILNNAHSQVQTQQGGWVAGNPWLAKGEAKVILNEVNSRDPSKLNGYIEVAGRQAQVVIANPAGITCDGCGFINANRGTLTTGKPQLENGELRGYRVGNGEIVVQGRGMDSSRQDYTDLIARTVKVNAGIWAKDLQVTTGRNQVSADQQAISASADDGSAKPQLAIDVAQLGGMYAGKIRLVATEQGVGVSNKGNIGSQAGNITLNANGDIVNSGTVSAGQDLQLSGKQLDNSGLIAAKANTSLRADSISNSKNAALVAGINSDGSLANHGDLTLTSSGKLISHGQNLAGGKLTASASHLDLSNSETSAQSASLSSQSEMINDHALLQTSGDLQLTAAGKLSNNGGTVAAKSLRLTTPQLSNRAGSILQTGDSELLLSSNSIDNQSGQIASNATTMTLQADSLNNQQGNIVAASDGSLNLRVNAELNNQGGTLAAAKNLTSTSATLLNSAGSLSALKGDLQVSSAQLLDNSAGRLESTGDIALRANEINNQSGVIVGAGVAVSSASFRNQQGTLLANQGLVLDAASLDNRSGSLLSASDSTIRATNLDNSHGQLLSEGNLSVAGDEVSNQQGQMQTSNNLLVNVVGSLNNTLGLLRGGAALTLKAASLLNSQTSGDDQGVQGKDLHITSAQIDNQQGKLAASNDLTIASSQLNNTQGQISASGQLTLDQTDNTLARSSSSDLNISNHGGRLIAGQQLTYRGREISGSGEILSLGNMDLRFADGFSNGGKTLANGDLTLTVNHALTNSALLAAGGLLNVRAGNIDNQASGELSGQRTTLTAGDTLTNRGLIDGVLTTLVASTLNNIGSGRLYGDGLAISAATLNNLAENGQSATLAARQRLDIGVGTLNNSGHSLIYSDGDMAIGAALDANQQASGKAGVINNHSATIESAGNMALSFGTLNNINDNFATAMVQLTREQISEYMVVDLNNGVHYSPDDYNISFYKDEVRHICIEGVVCGRDHYYEYNYTRTISEQQITQSDPGQILAGGSLTLSGDKVLNDKSRIIAGGDLVTAGVGEIENSEVAGQRLTEKSGQVIEWDRIHKKGSDSQKHRASAYTPPTEIQSITLQPGVIQANTQVTGSAPALNNFTASQVSGGLAHTADFNALPAGQRIEVNGNADDVVRSMVPNSALPAGSLFTTLPDASSHYLIETDPRFTNQKSWLSSDYMLSQLALDPDQTQKRLGDGFYEQRLIREQIVELVGQRYLADYHSDEDQYKGLMEAGVSFAREFNLVPGVALTAEQMAQITKDMVWLVAREVAMPDGSTQKVLVPQVYTQVKSGDIDGSGALLAAKNVSLGLSGGMLNSGRISASQLVTISGDNIVNVGGTIAAKSVALQAGNDVINNGGIIRASDTLMVDAGRDISVASNTVHAESQNGGNRFTSDNIDRVAGLYVQVDNGKLLLQAGRDVNLQAAQVVTSGVNSQTVVSADHDINLSSLTTGSSDQVIWDNDNHLSQTRSRVTGSELTSTGGIALTAGNNVTARAAKLNAGEQLSLAAGGDITLGSASSQESLDMHAKTKGSGFLSSSTKTTRVGYDATLAHGSSLGGENIAISAGHDIAVVGSDLAASQDLTMRAGNDLNVSAAEEHRDSWSLKKTTKSGLMSSGGIGFSVGSVKEKSTEDSAKLTQSKSTLGSVAGDTSLVAGNHIAIQGSDVIAGNDINMVAKNITLDAAANQTTTDSTYERSQSGLTLALSGAVGSAINAAVASAQQAEDQQDGRMAQLQTVKSALSGVQAAQAMILAAQNTTDQNAIGVSLSLSTSKSKNEAHREQTEAFGSALQAGNNINLLATGSDNSGSDGDITLGGSKLQAGNDILLSANRDINLLSAANTGLQSGNNSSSGGGVGISIGAGQGGAGISIFANVSKGSGNENGTSISHSETTLDAGNNLTINSGRDTTLRGAQLSADRVLANVGRNMTLQSEQDSDRYDSKQQNSSAGASFTFGSMTGSVSASVTKDKIHSNYDSVQEQTGIFAGDGGFAIRVGNHTQLDGAVIGSSASADKNRLDTATLGFSNIENSAAYQVSHTSVGISTSGLGAQDLLKNAVQNLAANGLGMDGNDGNASGTTYAAISQGMITVRDGAHQQQDISQLSRDVEHANQSISPIFDKAKEQQRLSKLRLMGEIVNQGVSITLTQGEILANSAGIQQAGEWDESKETRKEYWERVKDTDAYQNIDDQYKAGGDLDRGIRAAAAAVTALAGGDPAKALAAGAAPYMAGVVKGMTVGFDQTPGAGQIAANAIGHALLGGVVAELSGTNAAAGAIGAASGELAARAIREYLYPGKSTEDLQPAERSKISNLASLAGALAAGLASDSSAGAVTGHDAGKNAVDNNDLLPPGLMSWGAGASSLAKYETAQGKTPEQVSEAVRIYSRGTIPEGQDAAKGLLQAWGFFMGNALTLGGGSAVSGSAVALSGLVGGAANVNNQYLTMKPGESLSYTDAILATGISAITTGKSFIATQVWGMSGAYVGSKIKGEDATGAVTGAGVGNVAGKLTAITIESATKKVLPAPAAELLGSVAGSMTSEASGSGIQKAIDKQPQQTQGK